MTRSSLITAFIVCACVHITASITIDGDGGYRNIVIKVDNSVPEDYCHLYLQNLKEMLTDASKVLNSALDSSVYLAQVTVVIPSFWRNARCHRSIEDPKPGIIYQKADIVIKPDSPVFGSQPHTQQSRGCGEAGDVMVIPQTFLTEWNTTKQTWPQPGKLFVKEWGKLRYGVFDEHGYPDDKLYQNYFKLQNKILHSGNSNKDVLGVWMHRNGSSGCDPKTGGCLFHPEGSNDEITCSLGYLPNLPNVRRWCDRAGMPLSPTKHNILCSGRSAMQVILDHADFANNKTKHSSLPRSLEPRFDIVREPLPKYVLLIETSSSLSPVWKWVRKAVQNLIRYVIPQHRDVAVVTFNTDAKIEHRMVQLTNETSRSRMADSIPDSPNKLENNSEEGCFHCGIKVAINEVLKGKEAGGHLIIIAKDDISTSFANQEREIIREAESKGVRISSIVLTSQPAVNEPPAYRLNSPVPGTVVFEALAKGTGGVSKIILSGGYTMQMYSDFIESLNDVVAVDTTDPFNHAITLHRQFYLRTDAEPTVGSFVVDSTLGKQTEFGIYVEDNEDHQIKSVEFTDSEFVVYGPFTKMSSSYDVVNFKTINFNVGEEPPFDTKRGSRWEYRIEWYGGAPGNRENLVTVRSKPVAINSNDLIRVHSWTSLQDGEDVTPDNLLAIFVQVEKGQRPILDARVRIYLTIEDENGRLVEKDREITLIDNGYGEPDLTSKDGIYSRYVTSYPTSGKYSYKVVVDDNSGFASTVSPGQPLTGGPFGPEPCCGSVVPVPDNRTERIGSFRRTAAGTSVHVKSVDLGGAADKVRPGKIGDLDVRVNADAQQLVAVWTAPGGDYNDGEVMTYRFVFSQKIEELLTPSTLAPALDGLKESHPPGTRMQKVINFKYYSAFYYIGLYAFDEAGNRGRMSNIVLVRVPAPPTTTDVTSTEPIVLEPANDWTLLGAIIGAVGVLLLAILVGLYCRFFRRSQGRFSKIRFAGHLKSNGVRIPSSAELDSRKDSSTTSGGDGFEAEKANNDIVNIPHPKVSNTSFANNLTPTYWSASQLLAEHEVRKQQEQQLASLRSSTADQYGGMTADHYNGVGHGQYGVTMAANADHQQYGRGGGGAEQYSRTNEGLWVEPEEYMAPRGYQDYAAGPGGRPEEFDYPDVVNYNPGSSYSVEHMANDHSRSQYGNGGNPPGFSYRQEYAVHNDYSDYGGLQGDYSVQHDYGMTAGDLGVGAGGDPIRDYESVLNKSSQRLMNSDVSSSTLGITNPSLLGSQLSIYSGVPGGSRNSGATKNRNITQV